MLPLPVPELCTICTSEYTQALRCLAISNDYASLHRMPHFLCTCIDSRSARSLFAASISAMMGDRYG
jgi:hypothetical protein